MSLTDAQIRKAKPKANSFKMGDALGLYLLVHPNGSKYWRQKYRINGKEKTLSHGVYPEITLKEAREKCHDARKLLRNGIDPQEAKKTLKSEASEDNQFESIAREWLAKHSPTWATTHSNKIIGRLENDVFPWLGKRPIRDITSPEILKILRRVEGRGAVETAHRIKQYCGRIYRYAIATGKAEHDVSADLTGALTPTKTTHYATITNPKEVGELLRAIEGYTGQFVTRCALQLAPLVFLRPGELRKGEWAEIHFDTSEWRIPAKRMKMKSDHIVPLSTQAITILQEIQPLTGNGQYIFPSVRSQTRPMSENTVTGALRRLGYKTGEMTGHGFRSMASTLLNEDGWHPDAIERQLAHAERNDVRAAYNHAEYLAERRKMMQAWADLLDKLKASTK